MKLCITLSMVCFTFGCNDVSDNGADTRDAKEFPPASSAEELAANFKAAYEAGNITAIKKMVHWDGKIDEEGKERVLKGTLSTGTAGDRLLTKTELRAPKEGDVKPWAKLKADSVFDYTLSGEEDTINKYTYVPIVKVDGHYYFYVSLIPENFGEE